MNKKFKIVSSIALAGVISINVFNPKALAATIEDKIETNTIGKYNNLVEGKAVVPYVLVSKDDSVTVKEILNSNEFANVTKFNGTTIPNENTLVCTGDTFVADGTEYTVIIYGDVNKDGKANSKDALLVEEYSTKMKTLDVIQLEAGDVINDAKVNSKDSRRIKEFATGITNPVIDKVPDAEQVDEKANYTVNVNNNDKINNQNDASTVLKIKVEKTLDSTKTFTIKVVGSDGKEVIIDKDIDGETLSIPAHTDYIEAKINLSSIPDGKISATIEVKDDETPVKFITEKNTNAPEATNVIANRVNTKNATISLDTCGNNQISKIYYEYVVSGQAKPTEIQKQLTATDGSIKDTKIATDLDTDTAYDIWYILEDTFGNKSEATKVILASDSAEVAKEEKVEEINKPDLSKEQTAEFTWTVKSGKAYVTTLYKDGKAIATQKVNSGSVNYTNEIKEAGEGTYKIEVYVEGSEMNTASDKTASEEVTVTKLQTTTNLKLENENGKVILSWENANEEKEFKNYKIQLVTIDKDGKESIPIDVNTSSLEKSSNQIDVTSYIRNDTIYKAKVTVVASETMYKIDSDETVSEQFYKVGNPLISNAETSEDSITLESDGININGKTATYKIQIFDVNESATLEDPYYTLKTTRDVQIVDGKITIDGLESDKLYAFKLIATIDGAQAESGYTSPVSTLPELKNLTVVWDEKEAQDANKVYSVNSDTIILAGKTINLYRYNNSDKLADSMKIIDALEAGDTVSIENQNVTVKLDGGASANVAERDFTGADLSEITLNVESNDFSKTLKIADVKELTLKGTGSIFNLDNVTAKKINLTDGVEVKSSNKKVYTINFESVVTMNQIKMSTEKDTNVIVDGAKVEVEANTVTNDLVFENKKDQEIEITIKGKDDNSSTQAGTITIKENAKVIIKSDKVNVNADLIVEINSGDIDLTEPSLTGNKDLTVTKGAKTTINANAKTKSPVDLTSVELKDYTDDELKETYGEDDWQKVKEYLSSFGINGKGAKITVKKDSANITIEFEKATGEANIQNIK